MKYINHLRTLLSTVLIFSLFSCDLDMEPENVYVDEKVYRTQKTAEAALTGSYVRLNVFLSGAPQDQNNYSNMGYALMLADLTTDNLKVRPSSTTLVAVETSQYTANEHDQLLYYVWQWGYNVIDYANNVIHGVEAYGQYKDEVKRQHIAEAKFIRAYAYFYMLCLFGDQALLGNDAGDGLVMRLEPYKGYDPNNHQPRVSNAECWKQIITDLQEAIVDLPQAVPSPSARVRANKSVAQGLLSRVYLYKGTFTNNMEELQLAEKYAAEVLNSGAYGFSNSPNEFTDNLFPSNEFSQSTGYPNPTAYSSELMFFEPSRIYTANYPNGMRYYQKRLFYVPRTAVENYAPNDVRRSQLIVTGSTSDNPNDLTTRKYCGGMYDDVIYMRLAEMKLTYAETLVRTTNSVSRQAVDQLNDIHQRAFPDGMKPQRFTVSDFPDTQSLLKAILLERRHELAYEGHYRWDLMRTNNLLKDKTLSAVTPNRWNLPVPDYELRITKGLIRQNTGYIK